MKVIMKQQTIYAGKSVIEGNELDVPTVVADRWASKGLATILDDLKKAVTPLAEMTNKELYNKCLENGLEVEQKQPKAYYIAALSAPEGVEPEVDEVPTAVE